MNNIHFKKGFHFSVGTIYVIIVQLPDHDSYNNIHFEYYIIYGNAPDEIKLESASLSYDKNKKIEKMINCIILPDPAMQS